MVYSFRVLAVILSPQCIDLVLLGSIHTTTSLVALMLQIFSFLLLDHSLKRLYARPNRPFDFSDSKLWLAIFAGVSI